MNAALQVSDRTTLATRVVELRRARGSALVDGEPFNGDAELTEAERKLAALDDLDEELSRRRVETAENKKAEREASLRAQVGSAYESFLTHGQLAERAMADLVVAIRAMKADAATIMKAAGAIKIGLAPIEFDPAAVDTRMSRLLSWHLAKLVNGRASWGNFEWPASATDPTDFATVEERATGAAIAAIRESTC